MAFADPDGVLDPGPPVLLSSCSPVPVLLSSCPPGPPVLLSSCPPIFGVGGMRVAVRRPSSAGHGVLDQGPVLQVLLQVLLAQVLAKFWARFLSS